MGGRIKSNNYNAYHFMTNYHCAIRLSFNHEWYLMSPRHLLTSDIVYVNNKFSMWWTWVSSLRSLWSLHIGRCNFLYKWTLQQNAILRKWMSHSCRANFVLTCVFDLFLQKSDFHFLVLKIVKVGHITLKTIYSK